MKPYMRNGLIWTLGAVAAMAGIIVWAATQLPADAMIPTHWNASGEPDDFSTRNGALLLLGIFPAITLCVSALLAAAPFLDPRKSHIEHGHKALSATWIGILVLFTLVTLGIAISMVKGTSGDFNTGGVVRWIIAGSAGLLIVIGNYLPKTRSNFMIGVRTPWTLSSDYTWEKTHRLAGKLFILAGLLGMIGAFMFNGIWLALQLSLLVLLTAVICIVYSYLVWRNADDRDSGKHLTI